MENETLGLTKKKSVREQKNNPARHTCTGAHTYTKIHKSTQRNNSEKNNVNREEMKEANWCWRRGWRERHEDTAVQPQIDNTHHICSHRHHTRYDRSVDGFMMLCHAMRRVRYLSHRWLRRDCPSSGEENLRLAGFRDVREGDKGEGGDTMLFHTC